MSKIVTTAEICDRCVGVASHTAMKGSLELNFCNHHMIKNKESLEKQGFFVGQIIDQHLLTH